MRSTATLRVDDAMADGPPPSPNRRRRGALGPPPIKTLLSWRYASASSPSIINQGIPRPSRSRLVFPAPSTQSSPQFSPLLAPAHRLVSPRLASSRLPCHTPRASVRTAQPILTDPNTTNHNSPSHPTPPNRTSPPTSPKACRSRSSGSCSSPTSSVI